VLAWFDANGPAYPWRRREGDPYAVLVSEVMLQQTQASRVVEAFPAFLRRFPDVAALATASRASVLRAWGALGYHRRAVALHETSRTIVREHGCRVPADVDTLLELPGIGPYTAAAVASIAYGVPGGRDVQPVRLDIFDVSGRHVRRLLDGEQAPGMYKALWDGRNDLGHHVRSGVYFYRLQAGDETASRKMLLMQ